jgi:imidazoleglycerol-phosphate dehydratase/histidinol-phosphatase
MSSATRKILFVDRDGTLIVEPPDQQIDSYEKFALIEGVIPALRRCVAAGYELVMVTNQDGLGSPSFPQADFDGPQNLLLRILRSQGIVFRDIAIDRSFAHEGKDSRKPGVGLMRSYLAADDWSRAASAVIGDRETDLQFAANLGVRGFRSATTDLMRSRMRCATRRGSERSSAQRRRPAFASPRTRSRRRRHDRHRHRFSITCRTDRKHGGFLTLTCAGDGHVDEHHIVEDSALALGEALRRALGDKRGIGRYGAAAEGSDGDAGITITLPMDETIARAVLDLSGRPYFVFDGAFPRERVGELPTELVPHFFRSLGESLGANHVQAARIASMVEACFASAARCARPCTSRDGCRAVRACCDRRCRARRRRRHQHRIGVRCSG